VSEIVINILAYRFAAGLAVLAVLFSFSQTSPALAEDASKNADVVGKASSPSQKSPINVKVVDYQKAEGGPGTLKMSGMAIGGQEIFISVDNKPFAQVTVADDGSYPMRRPNGSVIRKSTGHAPVTVRISNRFSVMRPGAT